MGKPGKRRLRDKGKRPLAKDSKWNIRRSHPAHRQAWAIAGDIRNLDSGGSVPSGQGSAGGDKGPMQPD